MSEQNVQSRAGSLWEKITSCCTPARIAASFADFGRVFTDLPKNAAASFKELRNVRSICGMALLLALMVFVTMNDITRIFG